MKQNKLIEDIFGKDSLKYFSEQYDIHNVNEKYLSELSEIKKRSLDAFKVDLSWTDVLVPISAGVLLGLGNALFKDFTPLKHKHDTTNTTIDYRPPGDIRSDLHRQIGPGHDIFRFKEALSLIAGESTDFNIYGSKATEILGHPLRHVSGSWTFNIPNNPKIELLKHLLIDFFTKRSLPIPGSTYIADHSELFSKIMSGLYDDGLNSRYHLENFLGYFLLKEIVNGYVFLYKVYPNSSVTIDNLSLDKLTILYQSQQDYKKRKEYYAMASIAQGSSFLTDTIITTSLESYSGLFSLNLASLISFSWNVFKYLEKCSEEYNNLIEQSSELSNNISKIDNLWLDNFNRQSNRVLNDPSIFSVFDNCLEIKHRIIKEKINQDNERIKSLLRELEQ